MALTHRQKQLAEKTIKLRVDAIVKGIEQALKADPIDTVDTYQVQQAEVQDVPVELREVVQQKKKASQRVIVVQAESTEANRAFNRACKDYNKKKQEVWRERQKQARLVITDLTHQRNELIIKTHFDGEPSEMKDIMDSLPSIDQIVKRLAATGVPVKQLEVEEGEL